MSYTPVKDTFAAEMRVTPTPFSDYRIITACSPDKEEAVRLCKEAAIEEGWHPPTW